MTKLHYSLSLAEAALWCEVDTSDSYNDSSHWTEGEWNDFARKRVMLERIMEREKAEPGYLAAHKPVLARIVDWIEWCKGALEWEEYPQLWTIPLATFSDYSGDIVHRANARSLMERYPWLSQRSGGHGTEWLGISPPDLIDVTVESFSEFQNDIAGLDDYPLLDEDLHSQMEVEAWGEAWENWAGSDFKREIEKMLRNSDDLTEEAAEELIGQFDEVSDDHLFSFFNKAAERANEYWIIETGGGAYIDLTRIANSLTAENVEEFLVEVEQDKSHTLMVAHSQEILPGMVGLVPDPARRKWLD